MKKTALMIYRWVIISVILQLMLLLFVNNVYLGGRGGEATATMIETTGKTVEIPDKNISVKVPERASDVKASYDGAYVSYVLDGKLEIMAVKDKKVVKSITHNKDLFTCYKWLPDRNYVMYSRKSPNEEASRVNLTSYDVDSGNQHEYPKISSIPRGSEIVDIQTSTLTNAIYVKVKTGNTQAKIYKYNVMSELFYIMDTGADTVIGEANYSDKLVYGEKDKIILYDGIKFSKSTVPFKNKMVLLGISSDGNEDNVYAGELGDDGKVRKLYFSKIDDKFTSDPEKNWSQLSLDEPVAPEKLVVAHGGLVYELLDGSNALLNVKTKGKATFSGKYTGMLDDYIVSLNGNELKLTVRKVK